MITNVNRISSGLARTVLALSAICLVSATASAGYYNTTLGNGSTVYFTSAHGSDGGGEFVAKASSASNATELFRTFCVEENQNIYIPETVTFGSTTSGYFGLDYRSDKVKPSVTPTLVSVAGMKGIITGVVNTAGMTNELTFGAAALYKAFAVAYDASGAAGTYTNFLGVSGLTYTHGDQNLLQQAIWFFQRENSTYSNMSIGAIETANKYIKAIDTLITNTNTLDIGGVSILNLTDVDGNGHARNVQSQLYWNGTPGGSTNLPEPASVMMWLSVVGIGGFVRRRRSLAC